MGAGMSDDLERTEILLREFPSRASSAKELCFDEYLISDLEVRSQKSIDIGRTFITFLSEGNLGLEYRVEFVKVYGKVLGS